MLMHTVHPRTCTSSFFFFNDTATTEIYTLSLHDALPISSWPRGSVPSPGSSVSLASCGRTPRSARKTPSTRSEEHTSELQSQSNLVCRLLLEKKKKKITPHNQCTRTHSCTSVSALTCH